MYIYIYIYVNIYIIYLYIYIYIYTYIYEEKSLYTISYITEAKVFNIIFANSTRAVFRNPFLYIFFES